MGWRPKEGNYRYPPYWGDEDDIQVTILPNGRRKTDQHENVAKVARPKIIFVGGFWTMGWGISDHETFARKVQKSLPDYEVLNFGSGAYGTYQSLLKLEQVLPAIDGVEIVIYGFIEHHEERNVATPDWMKILSRVPDRGHVNNPYVTIDKNNDLIRQEPERYRTWPLKHHLAIMFLAENVYLRLATLTRSRQRGAITKSLISEMQEFSRRHGTKLVLLILWASDEKKREHQVFAITNGINLIDCVYPESLSDEMAVKGEGHPNGPMNTMWATCISDYLRSF